MALVVQIAVVAALFVACFLIGWRGSSLLRWAVGGALLGWALGLTVAEWLR